MKLIELLARELKEWPCDGSATQDSDKEIRFYESSYDFFASELADDASDSFGGGAEVHRDEWAEAVSCLVEDTPPYTTPTLETMLTEWRDLEARAHAAQAEADALFEHAGQCHGEIVVRLAELGWGAPRGPMVPGEPVVTLDDIDRLDMSLASGEIKVPAGLTPDARRQFVHEQVSKMDRDQIAQYLHDVASENLPTLKDWINEGK